MSAGAFVETLLQDVRYAARLLRRNPLFTLTAALSLAIGIGADDDGLHGGQRPPAALGRRRHGARRVSSTSCVAGRAVSLASTVIPYPDYLAIRERAKSFDGVYGTSSTGRFQPSRGRDSSERVFANLHHHNYFQVLGVAAMLRAGSSAPAISEQPGRSPIAVLSQRFLAAAVRPRSPLWSAGRVTINGHPMTIVGVAREDFRGMTILTPDIWLPTSMIPALDRESPADFSLDESPQSDGVMLGARLKPGCSRQQASAEMEPLGRRARARVPEDTYGVLQLLGMPPAGLSFVWSVAVLVADPVRSPPAGRWVPGAADGAHGSRARHRVREPRWRAARARDGATPRDRAARRDRRRSGAADPAAVDRDCPVVPARERPAGSCCARLLTSLLVSLLPAFPTSRSPVSVPLDARVVAVLPRALADGGAAVRAWRRRCTRRKPTSWSGLKDDAQAPPDRPRLRNAFVVAQVAFSILLVVVAGDPRCGPSTACRSIDRGFDPRGVDVASVNLSIAGYTDTIRTRICYANSSSACGRSPERRSPPLADRAPGPGAMSFGGLTVPGVPAAEWTTILLSELDDRGLAVLRDAADSARRRPGLHCQRPRRCARQSPSSARARHEALLAGKERRRSVRCSCTPAT